VHLQLLTAVVQVTERGGRYFGKQKAVPAHSGTLHKPHQGFIIFVELRKNSFSTFMIIDNLMDTAAETGVLVPEL